MMKSMNRLARVCLVFLLVVFLLVSTVAVLVISTPGLHFLINSASRWVPGLYIGSVEGGWRNLTLKNLSYQMPGVKVTAGEFHLSLVTGCIKNSELCLNALTANRVNVVVNTQELPPAQKEEKPKNSEPLTDLPAPLPIEIRLLRINNIDVTIDSTTISLQEFRSGVRWRERALTLLPTNINTLSVTLPKTQTSPEIAPTVKEQKEVASPTLPQMEKSQEKPLGETLAALFSQPLLPDLPSLRLPLDITIQKLSGEQLRLSGGTDIIINTLLLRAATQDTRLKLNTFEIRSPQGNLSINGSATLDARWPVDLALYGDLNIDPIKGERLKLNVSGSLKDKLMLDANLSGPLRATLALQTRLAKAGLPLALTLESPGVQWPLRGVAEYRAQNIRLRLNGNAKDYALSLRGEINGGEIPAAKITLDGKGNEQRFALTRLRVAALQGNADLAARLDWSKAISWQSELVLQGINTVKQWPAWPAKLEGKIATRGSLYGGNWQLQIPMLQLDGNVKQNQVKIQGNLSGDQSGQWNIPQLHIALGRNNMDVSGMLAKTWALDANIDAPNLGGALPGLNGMVQGAFKLRGDMAAPQILANLTASSLQWQDLYIRRVKLEGDIRSGEQIQGDLALLVEQLKQGDLSVSQLTLAAKGNEKQHHLRLDMKGAPVSAQLVLDGNFARAQQVWKGTLNNTRIETPLGEWRLVPSLALSYLNDQQKVTLGPHCWQNVNAELCVPKTIEAGASGQATVILNKFDLALLKPFLDEETRLNGVFSGQVDTKWADKALPQAKVTLDGRGVKVEQVIQGNVLPVVFDTLTLNAGVNNGRAQVGWLLKIAGNGQLDGNVQLADLSGRRNLSGEVNIKNISLALLNPVLMKGEKAQGMLNANLRVGGNVQRPQVFGRLALERVDVDGQFMPFDITEGNLAIDFDGMSSMLHGAIRTSQGQLNLVGNADWRDVSAWQAKISAKGDRVRVTMLPVVRLDVSPDIIVEASPKMLSLNGSVAIPWARITVQELPESVVDVSSDEVMLNKERQPIKPASAAMPINSHLTINIGQDVQLDAFGLKARLQGDLKMVQDPRTGMGLTGQVNIPSGRFRAYGQDLVINKGQLIFSGPPDQPLLNIEAIRNPEATEDGVTAGVRVTGLADQPKLEVFSDPTMPQAAALSYLLRGQGLGASGADGGAMTSMLIGMGVARSGKLVGKIGEAFGVSNLSLDTAGVGNSSQVVLSGYVLPGLQVKYGVGIFDSLATLTLRYRLMPKLYLEAVSGVNQALDLLYQFEF